MPPTSIDFSYPTQFTGIVSRAVVYTCKNWGDAWVENGQIDCKSLTVGVGTYIDTCHLVYNYGNMTKTDPSVGPSSTITGYFPPLNLDRYFVRVRYLLPDELTFRYWYGIIVGTADERLGQAGPGGLILDDGSGSIFDDDNLALLDSLTTAGDQEFYAYGMEWLLTRVFLNKSVYEGADGNDVIVNRSIPFNSGSKRALNLASIQIVGNKAPGSIRFIRPDLFDLAVVWTTYDILEYLFNIYSGQISSNVGFLLDNDVESMTSWSVNQNIQLGPTLFDALNQLLSPRRGLTWSLSWVFTMGFPNIRLSVHSFSPIDIDLGNGYTLPQNDSQVFIPNEPDLRNVSVTITGDTGRMFEQVKVYGARRGGCFTIGIDDETIEKGWQDTDEDTYAAGGTGANIRESKALSDAFRASDKMANVLTRFIVPTGWDGRVPDFYAPTSPGKATCPSVDPSSGVISPTIQMPFWQPGIRFERWIPLRHGFDYSVSADTPTNNNANGIIAEYRNAFAVYRLNDDKYVMADRSSVMAHNEKSGDTLSFSAYVQPLADQLGMMVTPSPLAHLHAANTEFETDHPDFDSTTDYGRQADYKKMQITVFCEFDEFVTVVHPEVPRSGNNSQQAILEIQLGDSARLDYLVPGTILDVDDAGALIRASATPEFLRDDRPSMTAIARIANIWYSTKRQAVTMKVMNKTGLIKQGDLVVSIGELLTNSLVTQISYDFDDSSAMFHTEFAEIDPIGLVI